MPKLPVVSGHELIKILSKIGFVVAGRKGSHVRLKKRIEGKAIVTTVPLHKELDAGTLIGILKQAEISRGEFFELMK